MQGWVPSFEAAGDGQVTLGHRLVDDYLEMVRVRARRNSLLAAAFDLKLFFSVVAKDPLEVTTADVMAAVELGVDVGADVDIVDDQTVEVAVDAQHVGPGAGSATRAPGQR